MLLSKSIDSFPVPETNPSKAKQKNKQKEVCTDPTLGIEETI